MNTNFDVKRELAEQSPKDWVFGSTSEPGIVFIPEKERNQWLPVGELQFNGGVDFTDCASRSPVNHLEALFSYHYAHEMKPENKKWLEDQGYVNNGKITFSDRYIAVLSGTTHAGNSLKSPVDTIHSQGLIPKSKLPKTDTLNWDTYYAPISQTLKDLGQAFLKRFTINYEQVNKAQLAEVLATDMVGVAAYAWPIPVNGVYPATPGTFNHAFLLYDLPKYQAYDNYLDAGITGDFTKTLSSDYIFFDYGYRVYISSENLPKHLFLKNLVYGMEDREVAFLQQALIALGYPIPHATTTFFGNETRAALNAFQKANGIQDDGSNFGPRSRLALNTRPTQGTIGDIIMSIRTFLGI